MNTKRKKLKAIAHSMMVVAGMLLPVGTFAQDNSSGGMLNYDRSSESHNTGFLGRGSASYDGISLQNFGEGEDDLTLQNFGEAPLGSGWLILMASGAGYAALKSRKKQNTRKK